MTYTIVCQNTNKPNKVKYKLDQDLLNLFWFITSIFIFCENYSSNI